ncbi:MAG: hypothetical protein K0S39_3594 [Paenibacillus sp.]|jgi:hypothetical protein|nr:hypothetical protein [Paenibacillus sp.]
MWESILKKDQWEIQFNPDNKSILFHVLNQNKEDSGQVSLQLNQSELFELLHAFLSINRTFNNETMYYDDLEINDPN